MEEFAEVRDRQFQLDFIVPTADELERVRRIHRDRTVAEKTRMNTIGSKLGELLELMESGEEDLESLPEEIREKLLRIAAAEEDEAQ